MAVETAVVTQDVIYKPVIVVAVGLFSMTLKVVLEYIEIAAVAGIEPVIEVDLIFKAGDPRNIDYTIYVGVDLMFLFQVCMNGFRVLMPVGFASSSQLPSSGLTKGLTTGFIRRMLPMLGDSPE